MNVKIKRRGFVVGAGGLLVLSGLGHSASGGSGKISVEAKQSLVLCRSDDEDSLAFAAVFSEAGTEVIALEIDLVRQWRAGLNDKMKQKKILLGLTNWSDYLMMRELAQEQRRFPMLITSHQAGLLNNASWASDQAVKLLELNFQTGKKYNSMEKTSYPGKALFSWVIS